MPGLSVNLGELRRPKTFLADAGAGAGDQALLAMLPVKHCAVRQLGLRRRVPVIDEAHACDACRRAQPPLAPAAGLPRRNGSSQRGS